jgi:hypothetical protein
VPRQLRISLLVALGLIVAAAYYLAATSGQPAHPNYPAPGAGGPVITAYKFVSAESGWIGLSFPDSPAELRRTNDSGVHWLLELVAPINYQIEWIRNFGPQHYVVLATPASLPAAGAPIVFRTSDDGRSWSNQVVSRSALDTNSGIAFGTFDAGWLATFNSDSPQQAMTLAHTTDGGRNWKVLLSVDVNHPLEGGIMFGLRKVGMYFRNAFDGWIGTISTDGIPRLFSTRDAGQHWTLVRLPWPIDTSPMLTAVPIIIDDTAIVISSDTSAVSPSSPRSLRPSYAFASHDPTLHDWKYATQLPVALFDPEDSPAVSFADPEHWSMLTKDTLFRSTNQGRTWQQQSSNLPKAYEPSGFVAIDAQVGWAVVVNWRERSGWPTYQLLQTRNSGIEWSRIALPVHAR